MFSLLGRGCNRLRLVSNIYKWNIRPLSNKKSSTTSFRPSNLDKKILVWTGVYKKSDEIPATVSIEKMRKSRDLLRIRVSIVMLVITATSCAIYAMLGKRDLASGKSITQKSMDFHEASKGKS